MHGPRADPALRPDLSLTRIARLTDCIGLTYQLSKVASTGVVHRFNLGAGDLLLFSIAKMAGMVSRKDRTAP